jgi:hypothetical protein
MDLISALINGPLIAVRPHSKVLHAASDESVIRGFKGPKNPRPRTTVDAVCGATRLKLVPEPTKPSQPLPWPPPAKLPADLTRCAECFKASSPKRPRTGVFDRVRTGENATAASDPLWPEVAP